MSYSKTTSIDLGTAYASIVGSLSVQLYTTAGVASGSAITSGFFNVSAANGQYGWTYSSFADGTSYLAQLLVSSAAVEGLGPITIEPPIAGDTTSLDAIWAHSSRTLTSGTITHTAPWQVGSLSIVKGDSYANTELPVTKQSGTTWPTGLTSGYTLSTVVSPTAQTLIDAPTATSLTWSGTISSASLVYVGALSTSDTNALLIPRTNGVNAYTYRIRATNGTSVKVLEQGDLSVG